jgi:hypothetical protein
LYIIVREYIPLTLQISFCKSLQTKSKPVWGSYVDAEFKYGLVVVVVVVVVVAAAAAGEKEGIGFYVLSFWTYFIKPKLSNLCRSVTSVFNADSSCSVHHLEIFFPLY